MQSNMAGTLLAGTLVVCGTSCLLAAIGMTAYLIKHLAPMLEDQSNLTDAHLLLVTIAAVPSIATFIVGVFLLLTGLKRGGGRLPPKDSDS